MTLTTLATDMHRAAWLLLPMSLVACKPAETSVSVDADPRLQEAFERAVAHGERDLGDQRLYNIEWDLWFASPDDVRDYFNSSLRADALRSPEDGSELVDKLVVFEQLSTGYRPTFARADALRIRYCVSDAYDNSYYPPSDKARVVAEMREATAAWSRVAGVRFHYLPEHDANCNDGNEAVDFAVLPETGGVKAFCASNKLGLPTWSCPIHGYEVWASVFGGGEPAALHQGVLVTSYGEYPSDELPAVTTTGVLKHELGHILGFRHEHPWGALPEGLSDNCYEGQTDPERDLTGSQLTPYDRDSVMHYPTCNGNVDQDFDISSYDGIGARSVYGSPPSWYAAVM